MFTYEFKDEVGQTEIGRVTDICMINLIDSSI